MRLLLGPIFCGLLFVWCSEILSAQRTHHHPSASASVGFDATGMRFWTDTEGQQVEAAITEVKPEAVRLRTADGERVEWKRTALSVEDAAAAERWEEANCPPDGFRDPDVFLRLRTLRGQMRYDEEELSVAPGSRVCLILENLDDMHHNWVLCREGREQAAEVARQAWLLAGEGFEKHWIPAHSGVLHGGHMVDPQATRHYYFTAPAKVGDYPYICTLPGHAVFMKGVLKVRDRPADLSELTYMHYHGKFEKMPDFSTLTPDRTDHVPGGLFDLSVSTRQDDFAIAFDGILHVPAEGDYEFRVRSDDGSILKIDGRTVVDNDGIHGADEERGRTTLTKGKHAIRLEYFERNGDEALSVRWSGPGVDDRRLSVSRRRRGGDEIAGIPIEPRNGEARIYRNFVEGAGNRAIAVGYPEGINLAFDADQMRVATVWLGAFMDAARHWSGRGDGRQPPLGYGVQALVAGAPFARLDSREEAWPETTERSAGYIFKGYRLEGPGRYPAFHYDMEDTLVMERPRPSGDLATRDMALVRQFDLTNPSNPQNLYFRAASGIGLRLSESSKSILDDVLAFEFTAPPDFPAPQPFVRQTAGGETELLVPIVFRDGRAAFSQQILYAFETPHSVD